MTTFLAIAVLAFNVVAGPPVNDKCENAIPAFDGENVFTTIGATTDGPSHSQCQFNGDDQIHNDVWFHYVAITNEVVHFITCGSEFDTKIAAYEGCFCRVSELTLLACNDDWVCACQSGIEISTMAGNCYTIRVGGFQSASGDGFLLIPLSLKEYSDGVACKQPCPADIIGNGVVDVDDLLLVINSWGPCSNCAADITANDVVDVDDLLAVINAWGPCS